MTNTVVRLVVLVVSAAVGGATAQALAAPVLAGGVAGAPDVLKRSRGRRGFEVLGRLQRIPGLRVEIAEVEVVGVEEVDRKLLEFARTREGKVVTNDYNLAKLAEVGGVAVLNVNEL